MVGRILNPAHSEESAEVEVLHASAEACKSLSKRAQALLSRLETTGQAVEDAIGPVNDNVQILQITERNIRALDAAITKLQKPTEDTAKEGQLIRAGPQKVGLFAYIASLKRVDKTLSQMNSLNMRANQQAIGDLNALIFEGNEQLLRLFHSSLNETSNTIEPLRFITKDLSFPNIPEDTSSQLAAIIAFMSSSPAYTTSSRIHDFPWAQAYAAIRGPYIAGSLANLATASRYSTKKKSQDAIYRQGSSGITTYATALENILVAEYESVSAMFAHDDRGAMFEFCSRPALDDVGKTLRELNFHIQTNLATDCYLAYEIIDVIGSLALSLGSKTGELKPVLSDYIKPTREIAKTSLTELLEDVRRRVQSIPSLPLDGAPVPLTGEVITRLQTLTLYPAPLASVMAALGDGNWSASNSTNPASNAAFPTTKSFDVGADGRQLLGHYITDTIEVLLSGLESKSRMLHKSKHIQGVFIANTVAIIDRMVIASDLFDYVSTSNAASRMEVWRKKGTSTYLDSWREPCAALMDVQYTNRGARPPSGNAGIIDSAAVIKGLGGKDKDAIKEKFKTFNTGFDDLASKHKSATMEREVRSELARQVQMMIEPMYGRFWDRYHEIDKGKGKYVKYDKGSLAAQLATLG